jgi:hypothetical protein
MGGACDDPILGTRGANIRNYFDDITWGSVSEDEFMAVLKALMEFGVNTKIQFRQVLLWRRVHYSRVAGAVADAGAVHCPLLPPSVRPAPRQSLPDAKFDRLCAGSLRIA